MKKAIIAIAIGALSFTANAGDWGGKTVVDGKAPLDKTPIEVCNDLGAQVSVGYMTDYVLHGARVNRDTVWLDANYVIDTDLIGSFQVGVTHLNGINDFVFTNLFGPGFSGFPGIDETDVYARYALPTLFGFDATLGYTHRFFSFPFSALDGSWGEVNLSLRRSLGGWVDLVAGTAYGLNSSAITGSGGGWAHRAGLEKSFSITDNIGLVLGGGVGYHDGYFYNNSGWSHYYANAALPIALNCRTTLTPYVGYNGVQQWDQFNFQGDLLHAGVSLNVSF